MTETANTQSEAQPQGSRLPPVSGYLPLLAHQGDNSGGSQQTFPPVLDACCGGRMMWFDRVDKRAVFVDRRCETHELSTGETLEVNPDILADFTELPFPDATFALVVFDPPHHTSARLGTTDNSDIAKRYSRLIAGWEEMLSEGFSECFRVLRPEGVLIFKWFSGEIPIARVLALTPEKPLFGHKSGAKAQTHWIAFLKHPGAVAPAPEEGDNGGSELRSE